MTDKPELTIEMLIATDAMGPKGAGLYQLPYQWFVNPHAIPYHTNASLQAYDPFRMAKGGKAAG